MATGAKASTTETDGIDDDERMAKAMPAAASSGAMVAMGGQDGGIYDDGGKGREDNFFCVW